LSKVVKERLVELAEGPSPGMEEVEFRDSTMCNKPYIGIPQGVCRELGYQTNLGGASSRIVKFWKVAGGKSTNTVTGNAGQVSALVTTLPNSIWPLFD
jgi:hypothetical protein